jgi:hypothetical protein
MCFVYMHPLLLHVSLYLEKLQQFVFIRVLKL